MSIHSATVDWSLVPGEDFAKGRYSRGHNVIFAEHTLPGTASPHVIGARWAAAGAVDPEELLVASISACHMLTFLHVARLAGFVVTAYRDAAEGVMEVNGDGRQALTRATLRPAIAYEGRRPTDAERDRLHHDAHEQCFVANSVTTVVTVEEAAVA